MKYWKPEMEIYLLDQDEDIITTSDTTLEDDYLGSETEDPFQ